MKIIECNIFFPFSFISNLLPQTLCKWNFDENVACDVPYTPQPCITLTRTHWRKSIALKKSNKIVRVFYSEWSHIVCLTWLCLACIWCMFYYLSWEKAPCPVLSKQQQLWCHLVGETELTGNWKEKFVNYKCRELPSCPLEGCWLLLFSTSHLAQ